MRISSKPSFQNFLKDKKTWTNYLGHKECPFNKKKTYKNFFVQEASKNVPHTTCNYCLRKGHISHLCPLRKPNVKIIQVWVPKGTRPQNTISTYIGPKFNVKARKV